ncbi:hypothetical protein PAPYR_2268 [Paratrimastix pyriformis]|uniref:Calcineurin-like phosphoesterase domain-containing protein n=1 Tax=Paratrimastix pyriformis TaxID=342808 RepID=A0ABQ8USB1_9EUKA|nr:hypothetical protein PAPYR_2268 [Paratrimastix pyriformis]
MRIQVVSDLHLEFAHDPPVDIKPYASYLALCGDISVSFGQGLKNYQDFIARHAPRFKKIFIIAGNHEAYHRDSNVVTLSQTHAILTATFSIYPNVFFLDRGSELIEEGWRILGCTLWSHVPPGRTEAVMDSLNDYRRIFVEDTAPPDDDGGCRYSVPSFAAAASVFLRYPKASPSHSPSPLSNTTTAPEASTPPDPDESPSRYSRDGFAEIFEDAEHAHHHHHRDGGGHRRSLSMQQQQVSGGSPSTPPRPEESAHTRSPSAPPPFLGAATPPAVRLLQVEDTNALHACDVAWLEGELEAACQRGEQVIVLTHHAPILNSNPNHEHTEDLFTAAFETDLSPLMARWSWTTHRPAPAATPATTPATTLATSPTAEGGSTPSLSSVSSLTHAMDGVSMAPPPSPASSTSSPLATSPPLSQASAGTVSITPASPSITSPATRAGLRVWFFGHTHWSSATQVSGVLVRSNQCGYPHEQHRTKGAPYNLCNFAFVWDSDDEVGTAADVRTLQDRFTTDLVLAKKRRDEIRQAHWDMQHTNPYHDALAAGAAAAKAEKNAAAPWLAPKAGMAQPPMRARENEPRRRLPSDVQHILDQVPSPKEQPITEITLENMPYVTWKDRVWSALLVILGVLVLYYSNFIPVVRQHPLINHTFMNIGFLLLSIFVAMGAFVVIRTGYIHKIPFTEWPKVHSVLVPLSTVFVLVSLIWFVAGLWPVFTFWSLLIVGLWVSCIWNAMYLLPNF